MSNALPIAIFSEVLAIDQRLRARLTKVLPKGMELSHFSVLNHLETIKGERTPAQLAKVLNVTRGAMSNTLSRLEAKGYVHIRPDWEDARQKWVSISQAGRIQRDMALSAAAPIFTEALDFADENQMKELLALLRSLRVGFDGS